MALVKAKVLRYCYHRPPGAVDGSPRKEAKPGDVIEVEADDFRFSTKDAKGKPDPHLERIDAPKSEKASPKASDK